MEHVTTVSSTILDSPNISWEDKDNILLSLFQNRRLKLFEYIKLKEKLDHKKSK